MVFLLIVLAGLHLLNVPADAQASDGMLSGTVTNEAKLGIPFARVTLENVGTGVHSFVRDRRARRLFIYRSGAWQL